jgi:Icc-related predicted phosphoesterase
MRVAVTSDLHGYRPPEVPECDLLLIAGDIGLDERFDHVGTTLTEWREWIGAQTVPVVAIAGNHDFRPEVLRALPWTYLEDELVEVGGLRIWGTPWSNPFGYGWAFNMTEEDQVENLKRCPDDVDVIVSHGPPYGFCDLTKGWRDQPPEHVGSVALLDRMYELPELKLVATGHIHSAYGRQGIVVGGSLVNERYQVTNRPIVVEI